MRKTTVIIGIVLLLVVAALGGCLTGRPVLRDTGAPIVNHPLMSADGYDTPQTGTVSGLVSIVEQLPSKSTWQLSIDGWFVYAPYTAPFLTIDRTTADHSKVTWNVADVTLIVIDPGTFVEGARGDGTGVYRDAQAVLIYTIDNKEYIAWSTACYRSACYGGAVKWDFTSSGTT